LSNNFNINDFISIPICELDKELRVKEKIEKILKKNNVDPIVIDKQAELLAYEREELKRIATQKVKETVEGNTGWKEEVASERNWKKNKLKLIVSRVVGNNIDEVDIEFASAAISAIKELNRMDGDLAPVLAAASIDVRVDPDIQRMGKLVDEIKNRKITEMRKTINGTYEASEND